MNVKLNHMRIKSFVRADLIAARLGTRRFQRAVSDGESLSGNCVRSRNRALEAARTQADASDLYTAFSKFGGIAFFSLLMLASCNQAPKSNLILPSEEIPGDLVVILERGICFGTCPDYKLTISGDGSVEFEGRHYVKKKGIIRTTISQEQLKLLVAEFERAKYFDLQDRYVSEGNGCLQVLTDAPNVNTSIKVAGKTKSIVHYHGCEGPLVLKQLTALEDKIDEVVNASQWFDQKNQ